MREKCIQWNSIHLAISLISSLNSLEPFLVPGNGPIFSREFVPISAKNVNLRILLLCQNRPLVQVDRVGQVGLEDRVALVVHFLRPVQLLLLVHRCLVLQVGQVVLKIYNLHSSTVNKICLEVLQGQVGQVGQELPENAPISIPLPFLYFPLLYRDLSRLTGLTWLSIASGLPWGSRRSRWPGRTFANGFT